MMNSNILEYKWWDNPGEPPVNLKTKKQLAEIGLRPLAAVGIIHTQKYDVLLYDIQDSASVTPKREVSARQLESLAKGRKITQRRAAYKRWDREFGELVRDRNEAIKWAQKVLEEADQYIILDTETTGLFEAELVQIGIIDLQKNAILDSLIKPTISIPQEVIEIHGITDIMVIDAPSFPEIYHKIAEAVKSKKVLIYNANFDISILQYCCQLHDLSLKFESECLMNYYAQYYGEYSKYYESYRWQPLNGTHNAIGDCLSALECLREMASTKTISLKESFEAAYPEFMG
jgi:DNA polymerase III subunit epsilon